MRNLFSTFSMLCTLVLIGITNTTLAQCGAGEIEVFVSINTDNWGYECYWQITPDGSNCDSGTLLEGGNINQVGCNGGGVQDATTAQGYEDNATTESDAVCLTLGSTYTLHYVDDYGDGGAQFQIMINGLPVYEYAGSGEGGSFDFLVEEALDYDVKGISVNSYNYVQIGNFPITGTFLNRGAIAITSVDFTYHIDGGASIDGTINGLNVAPFTTFELEHPTLWNANSNGEYAVMIHVTSINGNDDMEMSNDEVEKMVTVGPGIPNILDEYIGAVSIEVDIAGSGNGINNPRDLDFHPTLTRNELWVVLKSTEAVGGKTVKISDAGGDNQDELVQIDGNAWHFMSLPTGIAFSENENFATSPGVYDANHDGGSPFTGPALWSSDPDIYAQPSGGNGSHLDMLHESPYSMGIAYETGNKFWVTCGDHDEVMSYDFGNDHGPGNDDHSDGVIYKYSISDYDEDATHEVPDHLVFDKATGWLYVCNSQQNRVIRINTNTGTPGNNVTPHEAIAVYKYMDDFEWEVYIDSGLDEPTGIDIVEDRLIVSNYNTGDINLYDISGSTPVLLTVIPTESNGIMGVKIGPDGHIWYVNSVTDKVVMVTAGAVSVDEIQAQLNFNLNPNPANNQVTISISNTEVLNNARVSIVDMTGRVVLTAQLGFNHSHILDVSSLSNGLYSLVLIDDNNVVGKKQIVIQH